MDKFAKIETLIGSLDKLPTLPGIAMEILQTVRNSDSGIKEIGDIIAKDPSLSAEILKTVNSSYYGLRGKVASLPHAIAMLGASAVKQLALGFSLLRIKETPISAQFDFAQFWKGSLIGAIAAQELARELQPELADEAFLIGLLQDIGILALLQCMPDQYELVLNEVQATGCAYHDAEIQIIGFSHMEFGARLLELWDLPRLVSEPLAHHHHASQMAAAQSEIRVLAQILELSAGLIDLFLKPAKTITVGMLEYQAERFGFASKVALEQVADKIQQQTRTLFPVFEIEFDAEESYMAVIEEARAELIKLSRQFVAALASQKQEIESLREQATRDSMTGLINYRRFIELLDQEIYRVRRYRQPATIVMADIDHFKTVNDTFGHQAGDRVLTCIAQTLRACVRASDVVARYGGEEFGFILPETDLSGSKVITERLRRAMEDLDLEYEGRPIRVTMSFGIASINAFADLSACDLIRQADRALYLAKAAGRNQWRAAAEAGSSQVPKAS